MRTPSDQDKKTSMDHRHYHPRALEGPVHPKQHSHSSARMQPHVHYDLTQLEPPRAERVGTILDDGELDDDDDDGAPLVQMSSKPTDSRWSFRSTAVAGAAYQLHP